MYSQFFLGEKVGDVGEKDYICGTKTIYISAKP